MIVLLKDAALPRGTLIMCERADTWRLDPTATSPRLERWPIDVLMACGDGTAPRWTRSYQPALKGTEPMRIIAAAMHPKTHAKLVEATNSSAAQEAGGWAF